MLEAGDKIGEYTLKKYLGEGKYGVVWLAEKPIQFADKGVLRALKFLSGQTNKGADFESVKREVNNWIEASGHPNVASVSDAFIDGGRFVIASEYASGGSLRDWLEKNDGKAPSIEKAVGMMSGILNGLVHLHSLNITHRDLKPANILLHHEMPRIADFGMSRIVDNITYSDTRAGTWLYMSPEATKKSKKPQTDIWSVGVIFYEMLSGQFPFYEEDDFALIKAIRLKEPIPLPSQIPTELRVIVERALQKDSTKRFQTAEEMRLTLDKAGLALKMRLESLKQTIPDSNWENNYIKQTQTLPLNIETAKFTSDYSKKANAENQEINIKKVEKVFVGHERSVLSVAFSPDGKLIASGSEDKTIKLLDLSTGKLKHTFSGHANEVQCVVFSPEGNILASGSWDETVKLWDVKTGNIKQTFGRNNLYKKLLDSLELVLDLDFLVKRTDCVAFSPDGKTLASGHWDWKVSLRDIETGRVNRKLGKHTTGIKAIAFSPNGRVLASGAIEINLWNFNTGQLERTLPNTMNVNSLVFSINGKVIVSSSFAYIHSDTFDSVGKTAITFWDVFTGGIRQEITEYGFTVLSLAISPNGQMLAGGSSDGLIRIWGMNTGKLQQALETGNTEKEWIHSVAFSPDGKKLVGGCMDNTIKLWKL